MSKVMPPSYRFLITTLSLYLSKFGVQILTPYANKVGLHGLLKIVIQLSILVSILALVVGRHLFYVWGILVVVQRFLLSSWGFYDLVMADVIDADRVKYQRKKSVATSVHGVQSLIVKPAQSLAPMCGIWILSITGVSDSELAGQSTTVGEDNGAVGSQRNGVYWLTFGLPLVCSLCQLWIWSKWKLKGKQLMEVKRRVKELL